LTKPYGICENLITTRTTTTPGCLSHQVVRSRDREKVP